jgi:tRNA threonylcarbamoyl adenosine modification protein YeaZ
MSALKKYVLGLETGIDGGSISILANNEIIDSARGSGNVSKSEDLLIVLDDLLEKKRIRKSEIKCIVVSDEPGSLTGIRIGLAAAKGLSDALGVPFRQVSVLEAMAFQAAGDGLIVAGLLTLKNTVYYKKILVEDGRAIRTGNGSIVKTEPVSFVSEMRNLWQENGDVRFVFDESLGDYCGEYADFKDVTDIDNQSRITKLEGSLAEMLVKIP